MVKKAHLQPYLTSCELKTRYLSTSDRVESVEKHLLWLVSQRWTIQQASQAVGINYDYAKDLTSSTPKSKIIGVDSIITNGVSWFYECSYSSGFPHPSRGASHPQALLSECPSVVVLDLAMPSSKY